MKKYITIIAIIICGFANAQTGYLVQPAKWKFIKPQWLDSGLWIKNIPKYGGQNRILVYDSITNKVGYKYISSGATYTAGRGLTLNSNVFRLDTTQSYTWLNQKTIFNGTPIATPNYGVLNFGNGGFTGGANHFTGNSNGTVLAVNAASGFGGDLMNLQVGGSSKFKVDNNGIIYASGYQDNLGYGDNLSHGVLSLYSAGYLRGTISGELSLNPVPFAPSSGTTAFSGVTINGTHAATNAASGAYKPLNLTYTINNTGTASTATATGLFLNATETALNGMTHNLMDLQVAGSSKVKADNSGNFTVAKYFVSALNTAPSSASDTGTLGEIRVTSTYIYVCIATNTWARTQLSTW